MSWDGFLLLASNFKTDWNDARRHLQKVFNQPDCYIDPPEPRLTTRHIEETMAERRDDAHDQERPASMS